MARSGARRSSQTPVRKAPRPRERSRSAPTRTEYSAIEGEMFFPKLRRQAKWVFVLLALAFAVGFVVFGVGSGGGLGLNDILQGSGGGSSGPSVSDAQKKIKKGDLVAYKELADAYRQDGDLGQAISAGEQYLKVRPKDYEYMRTVAGDYEGQASQQRDRATAIQDEVTSSTGGSTFSPPGTTPLGRALGNGGKIDTELTTAANQKLTQLYAGLQGSYSSATRPYQQIATHTPNDVLLQLLLANAAYQSRNNPVALKAYRRVIKLAPDSAEAAQAKQQIQFLKAQPSG